MTKIDIFSGFLGAGKTTLIKKLIREAFAGQKIVLIENEFGEIGIDGGFLQESGIQINEMNSGCICCSLVGDFRVALKQVIDQYAPDRILIEPSGVGKLSDVTRAVEAVAEETPVQLNSFVTVADVNKVKLYMKNFGEFYDDQISHASCILLSRTQTAKEDKVAASVALIQQKNPTASIVTTPWDELTGEQILSAMGGKQDLVAQLLAEAQQANHHHHYDENGVCSCGHHHDEDEHEHHHHDHDHEHEHHHHDHEHEHCHHHHGDEGCCEHHHGEVPEHCHEHHDHEHGHHEHHYDEHGVCECGHHHDHDEHEHHHHDHDHEHCHEHHHDHDHEHHHEHGEHCGCGCHDHDHHHHHHADEVFASWGVETAKIFSRDTLQAALEAFESGEYGMVLRAKGIVNGGDGWYEFDYVPGEFEIRPRGADITGRLVVIGAQLKEAEVAALFGL